MIRMAFNPRFVNAAGNDLLFGKIHTIRRNYNRWKRFEGQEVALFCWEGKPYRSKQKVFCVKRIVSVQEFKWHTDPEKGFWHTVDGKTGILISKNDGFENYGDFVRWFLKPEYARVEKMAVIHFTDFKY